MDYSMILKARLKNNAKEMCSWYGLKGDERDSAFIFDKTEMNFNKDSFQNIESHKKWKDRLEKKHSYFKDDTKEMQSANSSDALLMNIFCYPDLTKWKGVSKLLRFDPNKEFEFGWNPKFENEKKNRPTEIDLKIGNRIFEAKLTENDFTSKSIGVVLSYQDFAYVFDEAALTLPNGDISSYQLIRNVLTAYKNRFEFTVIIDSSRIDLLREIMIVIKAIRLDEIKNRIDFVTWQEIVEKTGNELKRYISHKYF